MNRDMYVKILSKIDKNNTVGLRIVDQLKFQNKTQRWLASELNVKPNTVNGWIYGQREPNASNLRKIAVALGVSSDYLLGLSDELGKEL